MPRGVLGRLIRTGSTSSTLKAGFNASQVRSLQTRLKNLKSAAGPAEVSRVLHHHGKNVVGRIKAKAPVDTGRLRREVEYTVSKERLEVTSRAIDPDTGFDYAYIQNWGSSAARIPATYYFTNTVKRLFRDISDDINRRIINAMRS